MWSLVCSSRSRASTEAFAGDSGAVSDAAISWCEDAAGDLVVAALSPGAANRGVARKMAPSRVAAAVVVRALGRFDGIIIWLPLKWFTIVPTWDSTLTIK